MMFIKNLRQLSLALFLVSLHTLPVMAASQQTAAADAAAKKLWSTNSYEVEQAIKQGANVNARGEYGTTVLINLLCERNGGYDTTETLLKAGANANLASENGSTPLRCAMFSKDPRIVDLLIRYKADINAASPIDKTTAMHAFTSAPIDSAKIIIKAGANINAKSKDGVTPLMEAARWSLGKTNQRHIALLISAGADLNAQDNNGETALFYAVRNRASYPAVISLLIRSGLDVKIKNSKGQTAYDVAKAGDNPKHILKLLETLADTSDMAVKKASPVLSVDSALWQKGSPEQIRQAIRAGADVNEISVMGDSPIIGILKRKPLDMELVQLLFEAGADPNDPQSVRDPLLIKILRHPKEVIEAILAAGADVNAATNDGTPLHAAARAGLPNAVELLLKSGASVNAKSKWGTPLAGAQKSYTEATRFAARNEGKEPYAQHVKDYEEVIRLLTKAGAK